MENFDLSLLKVYLNIKLSIIFWTEIWKTHGMVCTRKIFSFLERVVYIPRKAMFPLFVCLQYGTLLIKESMVLHELKSCLWMQNVPAQIWINSTRITERFFFWRCLTEGHFYSRVQYFSIASFSRTSVFLGIELSTIDLLDSCKLS